MKVLGLVPARFQSSRFPGKPLAFIHGKPMILWVLERAARALGKDCVYAVTDDARIREVVDGAGFQTLMTEDALTGTDRLYQASLKLQADIFVNIQGDEPCIDPGVIEQVVSMKRKYPDEVVNAFCKVGEDEAPQSLNLPKVVLSQSGRLLYMSRAAVPACKSETDRPDNYYKQVCVYAFSAQELKLFGEYGEKSGKGRVEKAEDIEILRFLELDVPVRMTEVEKTSYAVDVPEDIDRLPSLEEMTI